MGKIPPSLPVQFTCLRLLFARSLTFSIREILTPIAIAIISIMKVSSL